MLLTTKRLQLRPLRVTDAADVLDYRGRADVYRYLQESTPLRETTVDRFVADRIDLTVFASEGDRILLAVTLHDRVIGDVRLMSGRRGDEQGEIGWVFHPGYAGQGYATEAARALLRHGFEELRLHRIFAQVHAANTASARVCERLGMRLEGVMREEAWFKGGWADRAVYALLDREWAG